MTPEDLQALEAELQPLATAAVRMARAAVAANDVGNTAVGHDTMLAQLAPAIFTSLATKPMTNLTTQVMHEQLQQLRQLRDTL